MTHYHPCDSDSGCARYGQPHPQQEALDDVLRCYRTVKEQPSDAYAHIARLYEALERLDTQAPHHE